MFVMFGRLVRYKDFTLSIVGSIPLIKFSMNYNDKLNKCVILTKSLIAIDIDELVLGPSLAQTWQEINKMTKVKINFAIRDVLSYI